MAALLATATGAIAGEPIHNQLSEAEKRSGWSLLFNGHDLGGWTGYHPDTPPKDWTVDNGTLHFPGEGGNGSGQDLITENAYENYELSLDWKVAEGGNSGIFYLVTPGHDAIYWAAPEMQVLDDANHRDGGDPMTSAGSAYALYPAPRGVARPAGEWNNARIRIDDGQVTHWLNGEKIVEYQLGSDEWQAAVDASKFADWEYYGQAERGPIGLQDHGDPVWFRNIKIRAFE